MRRAATRHLLRLSDGAELAYWSAGEEPARDRTMLLLHGAASNHTRWSELVERTSLTSSWRLLCPDLRGNGESTLRTGQGIEVWCRDLVELLDAERVPRAVVVGHSLGAQVAASLAVRAPQRVAGAVLIDPIVRRALRGKQGLWARFPGALRAAAALIAGLNRLGLRRRRIPGRDLRVLDEETRRAMAGGEALRVIAERYSAIGPILRHMPTTSYLSQMAAMAAELPPLEAIACPVLVLVSGGITFADGAVARRELDRLRDAEIVTLEANHWPLTEAPEQTRREIERWVERRFGARTEAAAGRTRSADG
jgi:pimeloyl-ACP methyl ester carboxylesterase